MAEPHEEDVHLLIDESDLASKLVAKSRRPSWLTKLGLKPQNNLILMLITVGNVALFMTSLVLYIPSLPARDSYLQNGSFSIPVAYFMEIGTDIWQSSST